MSHVTTDRPPAEVPAAPPDKPPRFSWPMRIFLFLLLFDMIFRSFSVLYPWAEWASELEMRTLPVRLATPAERQRLRERWQPGEPGPVWRDTRESLLSLRDFMNPLPGPETRRHLESPADWGMYSLAWLASRFGLLENLIGFNNEWPMFSPNVGRSRTLARARLFYDDDSEVVVRTHGDPVDLNRYWHWNEEKVLDHELKVGSDANKEDECFGWCNLLSHRYARKTNGAALEKIRLFTVYFDLAPPDADPRAWYSRQMELTPDHIPEGTSGPDEGSEWQTYRDFYEYNPARREGRRLER